MIHLGLSVSVRIAEVNDDPDGKGELFSIPARAKAVDLASSDMLANICAISKLDITSPALADFFICNSSSFRLGTAFISVVKLRLAQLHRCAFRSVVVE